MWWLVEGVKREGQRRPLCRPGVLEAVVRLLRLGRRLRVVWQRQRQRRHGQGQR